MMENTPSKAPASKIDTYWPITAAIWRNVTNEGKAWYSVTFERSYRDSQGNKKSSDSFSGEELLVLQKVAGLAHSEIYRLRAHDRAAQTIEESAPGEEG